MILGKGQLDVATSEARFFFPTLSGQDVLEWHLEQIRKEHVEDPTYIAGYLSACLDEGEDVFLVGLREVAQALGGISELAAHTNLDRKRLESIGRDTVPATT